LEPWAQNMRRSFDFEHALHWVVQVELAKRFRCPAPPALANPKMLLRLKRLGTRINCGNQRYGGPVSTFLEEPHSDAVKIAIAVRDLVVEEVAAEALLCPIDEDVSGFGLAAETYIAEAANNVMRDVVTHAYLSTRPIVSPLPHPFPLKLRNGSPAVKRLVEQVVQEGTYVRTHRVEKPVRAQRGGRYSAGAYCPIDWKPSPESALRDRAKYIVWWTALTLLGNRLGSELDEVTLLPLAARKRPWVPHTVFEC
jgi:hypothetical protein